MSNSNHTPGPWDCDPSDTKHEFPARQLIYDGQGSLIAEVAGNGYGQSGANAALIAASPDLLAACEQVKTLAERMLSTAVIKAAVATDLHRIVYLLKDVIDKAKS